jgi:ketosteroid isomerase-like protein
MNRFLLVSALLLVAIPAPAGSPLAGAQPAASAESESVTAVRTAILSYAAAVNAANPEGVIRVMADDIVLSYPGTPDSDYVRLETSYREMMQPKPGITVRTEPSFEEMFSSGDIVIARLTWTTTTKDENATASCRERQSTGAYQSHFR